MNKHDYYSGEYDQLLIRNIYEGIVISIPHEGVGILRVKIEELDKDNDSIPNCYPMFNYTFFKVLPKIGERIIVILKNNYNTSNSINKDIRYWSAIVHSGSEFNEFEDFYKSDFKDGGVSKLPQKNILMPKADDIAIIGKNNTILNLSDQYVQLSAGYYINNKYTANQYTSSSLLLSYKDKFSMLSGDKVVLIGNNNNNIRTLSNILYPSNEDIEVLLSGEPLPYGNKLVDFLKMIREILINHVHPYSAMKAVQDSQVQELINYDMESILNKNVITI